MKSFMLVLFILSLSLVYAGSVQEIPAKGEIPSARFGHSVVQINGVYYLFGGIDSLSRGEPLSDLYKFDPTNATFTKLNPTTSPGSESIPGMTGHNAVVHNNKMYVFNGVRTVADNSLYVFDPTANTWTQRATPTYAPRSNAGVAILENVVYSVGGKLSDGTATDQTWKLNLDTETFTAGSAIPWGGRWGSSVVAAKNSYNEPEVFVFGGANDEGEKADTWQYSAEYNTWQKPTISGPNPAPCAYPTTVVLANCLYIAGGKGGSGTLTVEQEAERASVVLNTAYYLNVSNPDAPIWTKIDLPDTAPAQWQSAGYVTVTQENGESKIQIFTMGGLNAKNEVIKLDKITDYNSSDEPVPPSKDIETQIGALGRCSYAVYMIAFDKEQAEVNVNITWAEPQADLRLCALHIPWMVRDRHPMTHLEDHPEMFSAAHLQQLERSAVKVESRSGSPITKTFTSLKRGTLILLIQHRAVIRNEPQVAPSHHHAHPAPRPPVPTAINKTARNVSVVISKFTDQPKLFTLLFPVGNPDYPNATSLMPQVTFVKIPISPVKYCNFLPCPRTMSKDVEVGPPWIWTCKDNTPKFFILPAYLKVTLP